MKKIICVVMLMIMSFMTLNVFALETTSNENLCVSNIETSLYETNEVVYKKITATANVKNDIVTVKGLTEAGADKNVTILVENSDKEISYINQIKSDINSEFVFEFKLTFNEVYKNYNIKIGGEDIVTPLEFSVNKSGPFGINDDNLVVFSKSEIFYIDMDVTLTNYVPKISGVSYCTQGKKVNFTITNTTDNTVVGNETVTFIDLCRFSYTLPSLISSKEYALSVVVTDGDIQQTVININIDTSILFVSVDGSIKNQDDVELKARAIGFDSHSIDESITVKGNKDISYTLPNLVPNSSFGFLLEGYETYNEDSVTDIRSTNNPELFTALKNARGELDNNGDGIITKTELNSIKGILDLSNHNITNIIGLGQCTGISGIIIDNNNITSLRPILNLNNLRYIKAQNNQITNISIIPKNLRYLDIDNNLIQYLNGLYGASELEYLSASHNRIESIEGIENKENLRYLKLHNNYINDISLLDRCEKLVHLDISYNNISDKSIINGMRHLYYVNTKGNE